MDSKLVKAMNEQLKNEFYSAYFYLTMIAYFEAEGLSGFSHWMRMQVQEESLHAMKFFDYLNERGQKVVLEAIDKPPAKFGSIEDIFKKTLAHEKKVTASINNLYLLSRKVNDNAGCVFLEWFINEQVEEEKSVTDVLGMLKYAGDQPAGILMLDKELSTRAAPNINPAGK